MGSACASLGGGRHSRAKEASPVCISGVLQADGLSQIDAHGTLIVTEVSLECPVMSCCGILSPLPGAFSIPGHTGRGIANSLSDQEGKV